MAAGRGEIHVAIGSEGGEVVLASSVGTMRLRSSALPEGTPPPTAEFALWYFLPIAMRLGRDLVVEGAGTDVAAANGEKLSTVWEGWMPTQFRHVRCRFTEREPDGEGALADEGAPDTDAPNELICYSGGVDSTYSLLKRVARGETQDLLTVHGMDYRLHDRERFDDFVDKTEGFAQSVSDRRILVTSNASEIYKVHGCNTRSAYVTHPFSLAGGLFLHPHYSGYGIAADCRRDQQYMIWPWGSESFTNGLFDSGRRKVETLDDDAIRGEKLDLIRTSPEALNAVTFCVDYGSRPHNCGRCSKCVRTKMLFLAKTGEVPDIFRDMAIPSNWLDAVARKRQTHIFLFEITSLARREGHADLVPHIDRAEATYRRLRGDSRLDRVIETTRKAGRNVRRRWA